MRGRWGPRPRAEETHGLAHASTLGDTMMMMMHGDLRGLAKDRGPFGAFWPSHLSPPQTPPLPSLPYYTGATPGRKRDRMDEIGRNFLDSSVTSVGWCGQCVTNVSMS